MPFLALTISHIAHSHLSSPSGESSITVPILMLNCFLHPEQRQMLRDSMKACSPTTPQWGQVTPFGHPRDHVVQRPLGVRKVDDGFLKGFRRSCLCVKSTTCKKKTAPVGRCRQEGKCFVSPHRANYF